MADDPPPIFMCALCGASHPATERDGSAPGTAEEIATLKAAWDRAYARAEVGDTDPATAKDRRGKNWEAVDRASTAYLTHSRATGVWKVPETITTDRASGVFRFRCAACTPAWTAPSWYTDPATATTCDSNRNSDPSTTLHRLHQKRDP